MLLSTSQPSYHCQIWVTKPMPRSGHTLLFSLPSPPAHISFSPGQGRTRKQPWKRLGCWLLRGSQGSSKIVLSIAEIWRIMHSILTPRSKTCQRLHEYQALCKLTRHLQYPALPNWEKSWINGSRKTHCNKTPSMSRRCPLPAAPAHPCASCFPHPVTPRDPLGPLGLDGPHVSNGHAKGEDWPGVGSCLLPHGAMGLPHMPQGTAW